VFGELVVPRVDFQLPASWLKGKVVSPKNHRTWPKQKTRCFFLMLGQILNLWSSKVSNFCFLKWKIRQWNYSGHVEESTHYMEQIFFVFFCIFRIVSWGFSPWHVVFLVPKLFLGSFRRSPMIGNFTSPICHMSVGKSEENLHPSIANKCCWWKKLQTHTQLIFCTLLPG